MYGAVIKLIAGGVGGGLQGIASNNQRDNILGAYAQSNFPEVPDLQNEYLNGYFKQAQATPQLLDFERALRDKYALTDAQHAASIYAKTAPSYAAANLRSLNRVDPNFVKGRDQLFGTVSSDLGAGSSLTPDMEQQLQQYVRAAQGARGNYLGNAPVSEEAFAQGAAGQALKQQRIGNMEAFLRGPGPEDKFGNLYGAGAPALGAGAAVAGNPGYSYAPDPGNWAQVYYQGAQNQFQDAEGQQEFRATGISKAPAEQNPWLSSLAGASGAIAGMDFSSMKAPANSFGGGGGGGGGGIGGGASMMGGMI